MTINTDVQSTSVQRPEDIREKFEGATGEIKEEAQQAAGDIKEKVQGAAKRVAGRVRGIEGFAPKKNVVVPSLVTTGACIASVLIASAIRRQNPLASFSGMGEQLPFLRRRKRAYNAKDVVAGIGAIIGGTMLFSMVNSTIGRRVSQRSVMRGAMATIGAVGMDALMFGPSYVASLVRSLGAGGTALKYGAIGSAYSLASRSRGVPVEPEAEPIGYEAEPSAPPVWSGPEVGTVAGALERPTPTV